MFFGLALQTLPPMVLANERQASSKLPNHLNITAMQGKVIDANGKLLGMDFSADHHANTRQVDISSATFESPNGKPVPPFLIRPGDYLIVIVDPSAPLYLRPKPKGKMMPMFVKLLPLKALVIESISPTPHGPPPGIDKG